MFSLRAAMLPVTSTFFRAPLASTSIVIGNSASPVRDMLVEGAFVVTSGVMVNLAVRTATAEATGLKTMLKVQVLFGASDCSVPLMQLLAPAVAGAATAKSAASFPVIWSAGGKVPSRVIAAPVRFVTVTGTWAGVTATTAAPRSATGVGVTSMPIFLPFTTNRLLVMAAKPGGMMAMVLRTAGAERVTGDSVTPSPTKPTGGAGVVCWGNVLMLGGTAPPRARLKLMGGAAAAGMSRVKSQRTPAVGQSKGNSPQKCWSV